jgi:hypothetical protein
MPVARRKRPTLADNAAAIETWLLRAVGRDRLAKIGLDPNRLREEALKAMKPRQGRPRTNEKEDDVRLIFMALLDDTAGIPPGQALIGMGYHSESDNYVRLYGQHTRNRAKYIKRSRSPRHNAIAKTMVSTPTPPDPADPVPPLRTMKSRAGIAVGIWSSAQFNKK